MIYYNFVRLYFTLFTCLCLSLDCDFVKSKGCVVVTFVTLSPDSVPRTK